MSAETQIDWETKYKKTRYHFDELVKQMDLFLENHPEFRKDFGYVDE